MTGVLPRTGEAAPRSLFDRRTFTALVRAMHPQRQSTTAARLTVGPLDREPDVVATWIYGAYATVLGRLPDAGGLEHYTTMLRGGGRPEDLIELLSASSEAEVRAADAPAHPHHVFVTGAYLLALGRLPDVGGLHGYVAALRGGMTYDEVLHSLVHSDEARAQLRFPPAAPALEEELARSVQRSVTGHPDPDLERGLVAGLRSGRPATWLAWSIVRHRGGGRRAVLRSLPRAVWETRRVRRDAGSAWVVSAVEANTEWSWRVQRKLEQDVARLSREVADLQDQLRRR